MELYGGFNKYQISVIGLQGVQESIVSASMYGLGNSLSSFQPSLTLANDMLDHVELLLNDPDRADGEVLKCINYIIDHYKLFYGVPIQKAVEITREFFKIMRGEHLSQATGMCSKSAIETKERLLQLIKNISTKPVSSDNRIHLTLITDVEILDKMAKLTAIFPGVHVRVYATDYLGRETIREYSNGHQRNEATMNMDHLRELLNLSCSSLCIEPSLLETSNGTMVRQFSIVKQKEEMK